MSSPVLTTLQRRLVCVVAAGAVALAVIGFVGSYAAVRQLAARKGFGTFALAFPIGLDAGIVVLLALDLLLTWLRMPFPLLRHTAWLLTAATIAFNAAAAWPDPLGTGMHAVIPVLFVVVVEAGRHAIGRTADITADKHMDGVRLARWLLSPLPTFLMWRRMKLWELRSYEHVVKLERERLIYRARLEAKYGRAWRRKAPVEALLPLRLARYGRPLAPVAPTPAGVPETLPVPDPYPALAEAVPVPEPRPAPVVPEPVPAPRLVLDLSSTPGLHPEVTSRVPVLAAGRTRTQVHARVPLGPSDPDERTGPQLESDPPRVPEPVPNPKPVPEAVPVPAVPVPPAVPTTGTDAGMAVLLGLARAVDDQHQAKHGRPASIQTLKRELHIGQPKAGRVRAQLDQDKR